MVPVQRPGGVFFSFGKHPVDRIGLQHFQDNDGRKVIIRPSNQPKLSKTVFVFFRVLEEVKEDSSHHLMNDVLATN